MSKNNFTRTNVDVATMEVSAPNRSSFDLSKRDKFTLRMGRFIPLRATNIMPNSTFKGSVNPELQMENFATPSAGPMRLDTHSFVVPARRVNKDYKRFQESAINGSPMSLPSFTLGQAVKAMISLYLGTDTSAFFATIGDMLEYVRAYSGSGFTPISSYNPNDVMKRCPSLAAKILRDHVSDNTDHFGMLQDFLALEASRLDAVHDTITSAGFTQPYLLGDMVYDLLKSYFGESSVMDHLGYDCITYLGNIRGWLNSYDSSKRSGITSWDVSKWNTYLTPFKTTAAALDKFTTLYDVTESGVTSQANRYVEPEMCEMQLRAAYACWFDWIRNYHVEKVSDVLYPDDFSNTGIIANVTYNNLSPALQLLCTRSRNWSRDMFTMIQPDDVYRHVYAPASKVVSDSNLSDLDVIAEWSSTDYGATLFNLVNDGYGNYIHFPSWAVKSFGRTDVGFETYYHDLQVMRRANMLEKYLQKNYFNSDTFAGQIEARYGVLPADYSLLVSQYIGGNESMINGEQEISPVNTPTSDAGERTLVANASSSDSFSYMCSDASYLINFASIVPIVSYDARNPFIHELNIMEQPIPEFASDNRIIIRTCDLVREFNDHQDNMLGYVPRYYQYRHAMDAVHGKYLREYRSYDWIRDRYAGKVANTGLTALTNIPMLTIDAYSQHINIAPDCFLGLKPWDDIAFGKIELPLFVECPLPGKVEFV